MPFFGKKFSTLKCPPRKKLPFHTQKVPTSENKDQLQLKLGDTEVVFDKGKWQAAGRQSELIDQNEHLKELTTELKKENNLLKLKIELLLDMLTEETINKEKRQGNNEGSNLYTINI